MGMEGSGERALLGWCGVTPQGPVRGTLWSWDSNPAWGPGWPAL